MSYLPFKRLAPGALVGSVLGTVVVVVVGAGSSSGLGGNVSAGSGSPAAQSFTKTGSVPSAVMVSTSASAADVTVPPVTTTS